MVLYMFLSVLATFITEGIIFAGIYFYETEILAESTAESGERPVRGIWRWGCLLHRSRYPWIFWLF